MLTASDWLRAAGSDAGAMHVVVDGIDPAGRALQRCWQETYYEMARSLALQGKRRRARLFFGKTLAARRGFPGWRFWFYYGLTYWPWVAGFRKLRGWIVRCRSAWNPRAF